MQTKSNSVHYATYGDDALNKPFADALIGFQPEATADVSPEKSDGPKQTSISAKKKQPRVPFKRGPLVALSENKEPTAHVVAMKTDNLPNPRPCPAVSGEPPQGNVSIHQLFRDHKILLQFLDELYGKKEKAICTFFHQHEGKSGKIVRSFLVLRVTRRPGPRIALCIIPGGTGWLAKRFPVRTEFFLDELMCQREAPEGRIDATRTLRVIMDDVRAAMYNPKNRKVETRQMP